jgi:hypothetical protein
MTCRSIVAVGSLLMCFLTASAQLIVTSSSPADGSISVPLVGTVSFSFNLPLDTLARYGEDGYSVSALHDEDSLVIGQVTYSSDLCTVIFHVTHTANTDFVWIVTGARSQNGQSLATPFALNYTTASSHGIREVSGSVSYQGGWPPSGTMVALFDGPLFADEGGNARLGAVVIGNGSYAAHYVRDGVYWPLTAQDLNGDGLIDPFSDLMGFYDPNQDGQADSIVVSGSDVSGITMELRQFFMAVTAREYLDQAITLAAAYAPDQQLRMVASMADTVGLDGTCFGWSYVFYSLSQGRASSVIVTSFFAQVDTENAPEFPPTMLNVPLDFVDSDVAISVAEANGGSQYRAQHDVEWRWARGGNFTWIYPQDTTRVFWMIEYGYRVPDSSDAIWRAYVDMRTGQLLYADPVTAEGLPSLPQSYLVLEAYPNPFNASTTIAYDLPREGRISLRVFDLLGREVALLKDGLLEAGTHGETFNGSGLASGIYFARLDAGAFSQTKKLMLLK